MKAASAGAFLAILLLAGPVFGQSWKEYRYPDQGFAVSFPAEPKILDQPYPLSNGASAPARVYLLDQGGNEYRLVVADFSNQMVQDGAAIDQATDALRGTGEVSFDIQARVRRNYGRQLSVTARDGSHVVAAIFFVDHRLFQIEGITHPKKGNDNSSMAVRFQQSLDFIGPGNSFFGGRFFGRGR